MQTLKDIMPDKDAPHAARVTAANSILDRGYGKPAQALSLELQRRKVEELSDDELMAIASGDVIEGVAIEGELQFQSWHSVSASMRGQRKKWRVTPPHCAHGICVGLGPGTDATRRWPALASVSPSRHRASK
jgi:hypothetical protein